ncbi:TrbI/VirB10 family protein, partial [Gluconobacter thailandicus]|uniref:TrbI/VirB10 family protein n=1 Tax=Gluconobacter thailandicus TaxID=257438 RepID=UPI00117D1BF3
ASATAGAQAGNLAFLDGRPDRATTSPDRIMPLVSPYVLQAGTVIAGALNTKISSDLPGQIVGHVTQNVYDSPTGRYLLIPQGSTLFGVYNSSVSFGQQRTQIIWTRLIFPNDESLVLEKLPGGDAIGQSGLSDEVNNHWGQLFKAALVTTLLSVGSEAGTSWNENNLMQAIRSGASNGFSMVGNRLIDRSLNVQPTLTDRPGLPFTVILSRDLLLKPYQNGGNPG